jgi:hypothetical protein
MIERAEVERGILDDERVLEQLAGLLESGVELAAWTEDMRAALGLALEGSMSRTEGWKAVTLRRHLFGPEGSVPAQLAAPPQPSAVDRKRAERLRSALAACVRYRVGTYLLRSEHA